MKSYKRNIVICVICVLAYCINRFTKFHDVDEGIFKYIWDYNFTDFLAQILFFSLCNLYLELTGKQIIDQYKEILLLCSLCCLCWELGIRILRPESVVDLYDVIAYYMGGFVYWLVVRKRVYE